MKERTRRLIRWYADKLLHIHDTPERTALAFALGTGIGFSPFLFLHWAIGLVAAFALRLNRIAVLTGTFVNNPYTYFPILAGGTQLGAFMLGWGWLHESLPRMGDLSSPAAMMGYFEKLRPLAMPFVVGNVTLSVLMFLVSYPLYLRAIRFVRHRHALKLAAEAEARELAGEAEGREQPAGTTVSAPGR